MNKIFFLLVSCAAVLGFANPAAAYESGIIKTVRGDVRIERGDRNLQAKVGDPIWELDRIVAQGGSSAGISMNDETLLSIGPNSTLVINKYAYDPVTRDGHVVTSILKGTLRYVSGLIGHLHPDAIKVMTQTSTIGIRGTDFIVQVSGDE